MSFLVGIIIFTFIFIFLSFFRSYFFFNFKSFYYPQESNLKTLFFELKDFKNFNLFSFISSILNFLRFLSWNKKKSSMELYKKDIKNSLTDQVTHAPLLEFL
jgi:magnesium-transporting ATPase (P-type)